MYYIFGTYTHPFGEVIDMKYVSRGHYTERGYRDRMYVQALIKVQLQGCSEAEIHDKTVELENAYKLQTDVDFGLFKTDGTRTRHFLSANDPAMLRGPYISELTYPTTEGPECVTKREVHITLEAIMNYPESQVIEYDEHVTNIGTASPAWTYVPTTDGGYRPYYIGTPLQKVIQEGHSIGLQGYYLYSAIPIIDTMWEHTERRVIKVRYPKRIGQYFQNFQIDWRFEYDVPVGGVYTPDISLQVALGLPTPPDVAITYPTTIQTRGSGKMPGQQ